MNYWINVSIIFIIIGFVLFIVGLRFLQQKNEYKGFNTENEKEDYTYSSIQNFIKCRMTEITTQNLYAENLTKAELERRKNRRDELKDALDTCNTGNLSSKIYVREYMFDLLLDEYKYDEERVNWTIPFEIPSKMTAREKFETLLYLFSKKHGDKALAVMIESFNLAKPKPDGGYRILEEEITAIYKQVVKGNSLTFEDKLRIITQIVYSHYRGFGIIDEIRDMSIDGVSGGVSGFPERIKKYRSDEEILSDVARKGFGGLNSTWIMYKGKTIHLTFISYEHEAELRRVINNIYKFNHPGQLSESRPYIISQMFDGARTTVFRPQLSESWAFFIRKKFDDELLTLDQLITHPNKEMAIKLLEYLMKGNRTCALTGATGTGKTTLLKAMVGHIHAALNIRVQETRFEASLRSLYPLRNILSFEETDTVNGQDGLNLSKKTDVDVMIVGEVATPDVAAWMIQAAQVASLFTLFTHHAKTFRDLVYDTSISLIKANVFTNEKNAEEQVVKVLEFDIHTDQILGNEMEERYIERVTECVPITYTDESVSMAALKDANTREDKLDVLINVASMYFQQQTQRKQYIERPIMEFRDGQYIAVNPISEARQREISKRLSPKEREEFKQFIEMYWGEANSEHK